MNPDTNQVAQALQAADMVRDHVQTNWPAICAVAIWLRAELKTFNQWAKMVVEYSIAHGGVVKLIGKSIWNRDIK
ncbi:MAG TPA: hypothetical protein VG347_05020 [Verrucomicrobiae bacterium]|nr:hypothetical protein [Verrucomicrobiae bacterium]